MKTNNGLPETKLLSDREKKNKVTEGRELHLWNKMEEPFLQSIPAMKILLHFNRNVQPPESATMPRALFFTHKAIQIHHAVIEKLQQHDSVRSIKTTHRRPILPTLMSRTTRFFESKSRTIPCLIERTPSTVSVSKNPLKGRFSMDSTSKDTTVDVNIHPNNLKVHICWWTLQANPSKIYAKLASCHPGYWLIHTRPIIT